jgi:hypothetical protein
MHCIAWLPSLLLISPLPEQSPRSDIDRIEAFLRQTALEEGALHARSSAAELIDIQPEEFRALAEYRTWRAFLESDAGSSSHIEIWQTYSAARSVQAACIRGIPGEMPDTAEATYWNGSRCLSVNLVGRTARLADEYNALGCFFLPREATGAYLGPYSIAIWVSEARRRNQLEVHRDGQHIRLRLPHPLTTSNDRAALELAFLQPEGEPLRFVSRAVSYPENGLRSTLLRVDGWQPDESGALIPTHATMEWKLASRNRPLGSYSREEVGRMGSVRFGFSIERIAIDAERLTSESLLRSFSDVDEYRQGALHLVGARGVDRRIQDAASTFFGARAIEPRAPRQLLLELISRAPLERQWASLVPEEMAEIAARSMNPIGIEANFCSQAALALIGRLQGQALEFSQLLRENPSECLTLAATLELARQHSLDLRAIKVDPKQFDWRRLQDPFLFLIPGEDAGTQHAAVAQHGADEILVWLTPSRAFRIRDPGDWLRLKPLGPLLVTKRDEEASRGEGLLFWWLAGLSALCAMILVALRSLRSTADPAPLPRSGCVGAALVTILSTSTACDPPASEALVRSAHVDLLGIAGTLEIRPLAGSYVGHDLELTNDSPVELAFAVHSLSCSCIEVPADLLVLAPGSRRTLHLVVREQGRGLRRERLLLEGRGVTQGRREIELLVQPIPQVRVDPPGASVTMEPNSLVEDAFRITAEGYPKGVLSEPLVAPVDSRFRVQLRALPSDERAKDANSPPVRYAVSLAAGEIEPGLHEMQLAVMWKGAAAEGFGQEQREASTLLSIPVAIHASSRVR